MTTTKTHSVLYRNVLASERWRRVRGEALRRANYKCERCGARGVRLDGHHWRGYSMLGREHANDVMMLCRRCHEEAHGRHSHRLGGALWRIGAVCVIGFWLAQWAGIIR